MTSPTPERLSISGHHLPSFRLPELGIPEKSLIAIELSTQYATARLDFSSETPLRKPTDYYAAFRRLARRLSSDCLQLGLAVPIVLSIKLPADADSTIAGAWRQADFDTELNAGEFQMLIVVDDLENAILTDSFVPKGLLTPITPATNEAYRGSLRTAIETDPRSAQLLGKIIEPNWQTPGKIADQLLELAESYFPDDESPAIFTSSLPTV